MTPEPLPARLGSFFSTASAVRLGVSPDRLRSKDLERPFRGARMRAPDSVSGATNRFEVAKDRELRLIRALAARAVPGQFLSNRSAALLRGMPMPHREHPELHLGVLLPERAPRVAGVTGHAFSAHRCRVDEFEGIPVTSAATTWVMLGDLSLPELVAAGDFLVRAYRPGYGRRNAGRSSLTTLAELAEMLALGRWPGSQRLRRALPLLRQDSWSPMESVLRLRIVLAGLPEPELNIDLFGRRGDFLGCFDLVYRRYRVAIEYQGEGHSERYAEDVERIERLRAEGWTVIEVTATLMRRPEKLIARVAEALRDRGWNGLIRR